MSITDGATLSEALHGRGINIRYLGYFLEQIAELEPLSYIHVNNSITLNNLKKKLSFKLFSIP
jgi:hypothetical protein